MVGNSRKSLVMLLDTHTLHNQSSASKVSLLVADGSPIAWSHRDLDYVLPIRRIAVDVLLATFAPPIGLPSLLDKYIPFLLRMSRTFGLWIGNPSWMRWIRRLFGLFLARHDDPFPSGRHAKVVFSVSTFDVQTFGLEHRPVPAGWCF